MRLADEPAREAILRQLLSALPLAFGQIQVPLLVEPTGGFTGADLKRLTEDGKNLFAYDQVRSLPLQPATDYFLRAVEVVRDNKARYAEAETRARQQHPSRPPYFGKYLQAMGLADISMQTDEAGGY